ncbi:citrate synthase [Paraburkholderia xenovorans]|uniref:citrate synthase (unknown stereospecificity) n=1 Tax=Paraburkholderia xenovorans (strain LB400) TaxID=266265 RepID=Q13GA8_PARXL|nr:citrate synthase [Paraburkholderia xenovorans]ABE36881.1 Citrate synthase [Paraburkholderia xenovorans LB400]
MTTRANLTSPKTNDYVSREEALEILAVKMQSFYTYVSRGLIRRLDQPGKKRKLYLKSDVQRLAAKSQARSNTGAKAGDSMRFGNPIIQTWICEITPRGPCYRSRLATDLAAANVSYESVAELLWLGTFRTPEVPWKAEPLPKGLDAWIPLAKSMAGTGNGLQIINLLLAALRALDGNELDTNYDNVIPLARRLIQVLAGVGGFLGEDQQLERFRTGDSVAECFVRGLGFGGRPEVSEAINKALVISAEHELTPPTFAARVCASTGSDLYACVATGILAHMGSLQGGGADGAEVVLEDLLRPARRKMLRQRWATKYDFPGFNHPLYERDPRAVALLDIVRGLKSPHPDASKALKLIDEIEQEVNFYPNITAALVVLCRSLGLPRRAANLLFSVSRSAGWIAHALEQRVAGYMLRPRAKFSSQSDSLTNNV